MHCCRREPPLSSRKQVGIPFAKCSCTHWGLWPFIGTASSTRILNWAPEQNVILRLYDELIKCGTHQWGLVTYYIPERDSGLGAFCLLSTTIRNIRRNFGGEGLQARWERQEWSVAIHMCNPKPKTRYPWWVPGILDVPTDSRQ